MVSTGGALRDLCHCFLQLLGTLAAVRRAESLLWDPNGFIWILYIHILYYIYTYLLTSL